MLTSALAIRMLLGSRVRLAPTVAGIASTFFLSLCQAGLLVGWADTTAAIVRHSGAGLWVMSLQTPAFDYGTAIPRVRVSQVRSVPVVCPP